MLNSLLVSVVVPFRNSPADMFVEALESIWRQTHASWELLLVDDGDAGPCREIALRWAENSQGAVRYLHHPDHANRGAAASRNLGIREARGEYVAFLDADDVWLPEKLEQQLDALRRHPQAVMTYGAYLCWQSWAGADVADSVVSPCEQGEQLLNPPELLRLYLRDHAIPGVCGLLLLREVALELRGFEESLVWSEDQTLPYKVGLQHPVCVSATVQWKYRKHAQSTTRAFRNARSRTLAHLKFLRWVGRYFASRGVSDRSLWQALHHWRRKYRRSLVKQRVIHSGDWLHDAPKATFRRVTRIMLMLIG